MALELKGTVDVGGLLEGTASAKKRETKRNMLEKEYNVVFPCCQNHVSIHTQCSWPSPGCPMSGSRELS